MSIKIYSVEELNKLIKDIIESNFYGIWVEGEISSLRYSSTGHLYFSLIDEHSSLGVIVYKNRLNNIRFNIKNGLKVVIFGSLSLYLKGGEYRIVAEHVRISGSGKKFFELEKLKKEFKAKGYFDRKRAIPIYPKKLIIVTSPTGAAIQDIINILQRRGFDMYVYIYPVSVQGNEAKKSILKAFQEINTLHEIDLVILARGGGSNEDLWIFNDPDIAKAFFDIKFPTISAIGHEIDFTLCDFVADLRAETPSAAAELITKTKLDIINSVKRFQRYLNIYVKNVINTSKRKLLPFTDTRYHARIRGFINNKILYLDKLEQTLYSQTINRLARNTSIFQVLSNSLDKNNPHAKLKNIEHKADFFKYRISKALSIRIESSRKNLEHYLYKLTSLNPENILKRGYTITTDTNGKLIKSAYALKKQDIILTRFSDGTIKSIVKIQKGKERI